MAHFDVFFLGVVSGVLGTLFVIRLCADWRAFRSCLVDVPDDWRVGKRARVGDTTGRVVKVTHSRRAGDWLTIDCGDGHITIAQAHLTQILLEGEP